MYFGSVRFFKHCIVFITFLFIIALAVLVAVLMLKNNTKKDEIETLKIKNNALEAVVDFNNGNGVLTVEDYYVLMEKFNIDREIFLKYIYNTDKELYESIMANEKNKDDQFNIIETNSGTLPEANLPEKTTPDRTTPAPDTSTTPITSTAPATTTTTQPLEKRPEYMDLFPDMQVSPDLSAGYDDDNNYVYLTFDDGPSKYTNDVLNILDSHEVKATFFVIPDDNETCSNYLNRMLANGHSIGIHSMSHVYEEIYTDVESFLTDFYNAFSIVYKQTGTKPFLFRFPGGSINDYNDKIREDIVIEMKRRGFIYYDWNVDSKDSSGATWTQMYESILPDIGRLYRSVVLFHDGPGRYNTVLVLEDIILALKMDARDYVFSAIKEKTLPEQF